MPRSNLNLRAHLCWLFVVQAALLALAATENAQALNPDAIAYCRIAGYYAAGQLDLAITGYWGPLLSWLMVPLFKLGCAPLAAARGVMALSGVVFLAGAVSAFRAFRLPPRAWLTGAWLAALWSVFWSVRNISPDLLLAGLVNFALAATVKEFFRPLGGEQNSDGQTCSSALMAGVLWGAGFLAKAVALPLAFLFTASCALLATWRDVPRRADAARRLGLTWLALALVAGPWIGVLSWHYGKFTFSTTGPLAHALAGPGERASYHPAMTTLHAPDAGRVTQWEEPSRMAYATWSPWASGEYFRHQLAVIAHNLAVMETWLSPWSSWLSDAPMPWWRRWLGAFDLLGLGAVACALVASGAIFRWPRRLAWRWLVALLMVILLAGLYLPFFVMVEDSRYFYPLWPGVWLLAVVVRPRDHAARKWVLRAVLMSFTVSAVVWCVAALRGLPNSAAHTAVQLANELRGQTGPLAGSGSLPGGRTGLYAAFLLGERWLGDDATAGPDAFAKVGARIAVVRAGTRQAEAFARDPGWRLLATDARNSLAIFLRESR